MRIILCPTPATVQAAKPMNEAALSKFITVALDGVSAVTISAPASPEHTRKMAGKQALTTFELLNKGCHMAGSHAVSRAAFNKQALTRAVNAEGA